MNKDVRRTLRDIYQRMAAPERQVLERALLMNKRDRFGLIASIAGLSDEEQEFLFNFEKLTNDEVADLIAYAARGFIMKLIYRIFGL